jgi:hypothetical protein
MDNTYLAVWIEASSIVEISTVGVVVVVVVPVVAAAVAFSCAAVRIGYQCLLRRGEERLRS